MSLSNWHDNGWLVAHEPTAQEIADLFAVAERDFEDSAVSGLSTDTQLALAYNAALQVSAAALAAAGYRPTRERKHHWAIQSLAHTIGADSRLVARLDAFRKKRNIGDYERAGSTSSKEAEEMRVLARELVTRVRTWLGTSHPELLPKGL
jgi:hypothetical protein